MGKTHEYQRGTQVFIVLLYELSAEILRLLAMSRRTASDTPPELATNRFSRYTRIFEGALVRYEIKLTQPLAVQSVRRLCTPSGSFGSCCDQKSEGFGIGGCINHTLMEDHLLARLRFSNSCVPWTRFQYPVNGRREIQHTAFLRPLRCAWMGDLRWLVLLVPLSHLLYYSPNHESPERCCDEY